MKLIAPTDGAFLVTSTLEKEVSIKNTAIVRGVSTVYDPDQQIDTTSDSKITQGLDNKRITVLFSGGLREGKGIDTFLDAVDSFDNTSSCVQFIVCGHGTEERKQQIRDRIDEINLNSIEFLGTVDPWTAYLELLYSVDILVALEDPRDIYNQHCFPSKLVEYAMTGNIILTSDISDVKEIKQDPFIVIKEYSGTEVAKTLQRVTGNIEAKKKNAKIRTQRWIAEECSVEAVAGKVKRVLTRAK
jgi:glycosyltransferase involved in cell wall biosynthesis